MKTMMYVILDRSASMGGKESDVVGGVNKLMEDQRKLPDPACICFVRFDDQYEVFRPMTDLREARDLTRDEYVPRGYTALLDAVGKTIMAAEEDWKREKPDRAVMMIVTDGQENASKEYKKAKVKELIEARQKSGLWAFMYLGANVDSFSEAGAIGIATANTANYTASAAGLRGMFKATSESFTEKRLSGDMLSNTTLGGTIAEDNDP